MKKFFSRALIMFMVTLSSVVLLAACSNQKSETSTEGKTKTSQVTKSSDTKASSKVSGSKSASSSSQIKGPDKPSLPSSSSSYSSKASSSQKTAPKASESQPKAEESQSQVEVDMDVNAVARGQYDSISGTWKANDGSLLIFNQTTLVGVVNPQKQAKSRNYVVSKGDYKDGSGQYEATLSNDNGDMVTNVGDLRFVSKKAAVSGPSYEQDTIQLTSNGVTTVYFKASNQSQLPSDVTITDNQKPIPANSGLSDSGTYVLTKRALVKNSPSNSAPVVFYLEPGYKINFDLKVTEDGHDWLSYISYSGVRRYVQMD